MHKKVIRFFLNPLDGREKWLNKMADRGLRLMETSKWYYVFEECDPSAYQYRVEFAADKSRKELERYKAFLQDLNIRAMEKNLNYNYSFGKVRVRVLGRDSVTLATSPGNINSELLILEKRNDGKPFDIYTDHADRISYFRKIRNSFFTAAILFIVLLFWGQYNVPNAAVEWILKFIIAFLAVLFSSITGLYCLRVHHLKKESKTNE